MAVLWALSGLILLVAPGWVAESAMSQGALGEDAWLRVAGVMSIALAAQMVLVTRRIEELWWWSWTFVLLEMATALVLVVSGLVGLPEGAASWPWWAVGVVHAGLAGSGVTALARAGTERSPA
jgi:hypothetical protein